MSEHSQQKKSNQATPLETQFKGSNKPSLIKLDLGGLEDTISNLYSQTNNLKEKIDNVEINEETVEGIMKKIIANELKTRENKDSLANIQTKIISIEQQLLKNSELSAKLDKEILVAKASERELRSAMKREIKALNSKVFESEKRLPQIAQQFSKPIEDKLIMAYSLIDDLERQMEKFQRGEAYSSSEGEYEDDSEIHSIDNSEEVHIEELTSQKEPEGEKTDYQDPIKEQKEIIPKPKKKKKKKKNKARARDILKELQSKKNPKSKEELSSPQFTPEFKTEIENRIADLEMKIKYGLYGPDAPDLEFLKKQAENGNGDQIKVDYGEFATKRADGELFDEDQDDERLLASKYALKEAHYKEKIKKNDEAVYMMYNKYRYLTEELDLYKNTLMDKITEIDEEAEGEEQDEGEGNKEKFEPILPKKIEDLTPEEKDYNLYILSKELKLTRWNSTLDSAVQILKKNNVENNAHIREQKVLIDQIMQRFSNTEENTKILRTALKDFKLEVKDVMKSAKTNSDLRDAIKDGKLNPFNNFVLQLSQHITRSILSSDEILASLDKNQFDPSDLEEQMNQLKQQFHSITFDLADKSGKSYVDTIFSDLRESIHNIGLQMNDVKNRSELKITSIKDLANDETLEKIFKELVDGRYKEYEKNLAKVLGRQDTIQSDLEKCFEDYHYMMSLKIKIEANEQRLDKMMKILENNAFEDEGFSPDLSDGSVTDEKLDEMGSEIIKGENTESGEGDKELKLKNRSSKEIRHSESSSTLQPPKDSLQPPNSSKSSRKASHFQKRPHPKPSSKKIGALKVMFVNMEAQMKDIKAKMEQREQYDQIISNSASELTDSMGDTESVRNLLKLEFQGMKQLVGKQQMSILKIENVLRLLNDWKNELDITKILHDELDGLQLQDLTKENEEKEESVKPESPEKNATMEDDNKKLLDFKLTVQENVKKELHEKIDRRQFRLANNSMIRKMEKIEKNIEDLSKLNRQQREYAKPLSTLFKTNEKCISCNRKFPKTNDESLIEEQDKKKRQKQNKYVFKEIYKNAPKLGSGYSRILSTLNDVNDINTLTVEGSFAKTEDSRVMIPSVEIVQNKNHMSGIMSNHRRNNSNSNRNTQKVLPKVNLSGSVSILPSINTSLNKGVKGEPKLKTKRFTNRNFGGEHTHRKYGSRDNEL
ncbi:unnamed protein product [Moneuplotes crassus]|uniref:Uncharacterized protein n=4 Tax=Euplotes crassus TaxID=5936 RepID=A0AAD1XEX2_EUPCR|nr:unnamed protein product [Moneuplotes crassus]